MQEQPRPLPTVLSSVGALSGILDAVPHPIFVKDADTRFLTVNQAMCRLMGRTYEELVGKTDYDFVPPEQADIYRGNDLRVLNTGEPNDNEELLTDSDGRLRIVVTEKKRLILQDGSRLIVGCITDISAFRQAEALIRHNAEHDALTGLLNRRGFQKASEAMAAAVDETRPLSVLLIDLDRFKPVNDIHGHTMGDAILCAVASRISGSVRGADAVARIGGDEFAVLCRGGDGATDDAMALSERLIAEISKPIGIREGADVVRIGASIGIAEAPRNGTDIEQLLHCADMAMYRAKSRGTGRFCFYEPAMETDLRDRAALEADLRIAIAEDQIVPFYQPILNLSDRSLTGFEVLARWQHPTRGLIGPDVFIPIAEQVGLITEITLPLLRKACRDAIQWPSEIALAINISPRQLLDATLPIRLLAVLSETDFAPGRLEVEITESALVSDIGAAGAMLNGLRSLGIKSALDDFGTGYSSMYHLREMRFDKIKIDRSFIQSMQTSAESSRVVSAFLALAGVLDLPVVAEGIESADIMNSVIDKGCAFGQGFFFAEALPAHDVPDLLKHLRIGDQARTSAA
jgi:diguanylate cyclase (GGDEF)-like protein/PAS domain S-box-containing protein